MDLKRLWSGAFIVIALAGFALRSGALAWGLPYQLDPDEPLLFIGATQIRLLGHRELKANYPPLRIYELAGEQWVTEAASGGAARQDQIFFFGRAFSALYSVVLLALAYQLGRRIHSRAAGALMAMFLAAESAAVVNGSQMRADVLAWLLALAALIVTVVSVERRSQRWLAPALGLSAAAFLAKYNMLPVIAAPAFVGLFTVVRKRWARMAWLLGGAFLLIAGILLLRTSPLIRAILLEVFNLRRLLRPNYDFATQLRENAQRIVENLGAVNLVAALLGLGLAWGTPGRSGTHRMKLGALAFSGAVAAVIYTQAEARFKDMYYLVLIFALFWAVGIATMARWIRPPVLGAATAILVGGLLAAPWVRADLDQLAELRRPDTRVATAEWLRRTVPQGARVACEYDCAELQGGYGGFPGPQSFHTEVAHSIYDRRLAEYQASGIEYLIADNRASGFFSGDVDPAFAANVNEVARFQDGEFVGPDRVIFQVPPIQQHALYRRIGDAISFRGFDLPQTTVVAGKDLSVTLYWMSARTTPANLIVFVHLAKDENSAPVAQFDGPPLNGTQPTFECGGDMQFWIDPRTIPLAADVPPGQYQLRVGMYDADTGERLSVRSPKGEEQGTAMLLGEITVAR